MKTSHLIALLVGLAAVSFAVWYFAVRKVPRTTAQNAVAPAKPVTISPLVTPRPLPSNTGGAGTGVQTQGRVGQLAAAGCAAVTSHYGKGSEYCSLAAPIGNFLDSLF